MRKLLATIIILTAFTGFSYAQQITGIIKDDQGKPLSGATVVLKKSKDSAIVKLNASNATGEYSFSNVEHGDYFVTATHVGYMGYSSDAFNLNGSPVTHTVTMNKATGNLNAVVVTSKKPMVEVRADKTILNVEGSINAVGSDALELLRKSPGVMVDKDDNLSLAGKNGVQVYIDGRPTPLSGADLAAYLKSLQSASIESIEIITNPSAKYEAAGNAGIINIRLKKNKAFGTNGSASIGYAVGIYPKYNAGINWNHRNKGVNIFGNYNFSDFRNAMSMNLYRKQLDTLFDQRGNMLNAGEGHNFKGGIDFTLTSRSTLGIMVNGNRNESVFSNLSRTPISYIPSGQLVKTLAADNDSRNTRYHTNFNANYRYADTSGRELNIDGDYGIFKLNNNQMQRNYYFDAANAPYDTRIYNFIAPTDINIKSIKVDYEQKLGQMSRIGFGGKLSNVETENDFNRYNVEAGGKQFDSTRSNGFDYKEQINALYVNYNTSGKNVTFQFGVRMENTKSDGISNGYKWNGLGFESSRSSFKRSYTDFFPSAAITFTKNPMSQIGLRYSRRIDRPQYQDLNPFEFKLDEYTFQKGNTELRPQYTNSITLTHAYKYKLNSSLTYSHVDDVFTQLIDTAEKSKSFITKKNLATQDVFAFNISYPFMYKAYTAFANLNTNYSKYKADFGTGRTINLDAFTFNLYMQHSIKFAKVYTGELSGFYQAPSIWQGTFESKAIYGIDAGIMRTLFDGRANLKASVSDIFSTMKWSGESNFAGQYLRASGTFEAQQFKLNFTYRFGSNTVKAARQRKTSIEDESNRVGNQGGGIQQ